MQKTSVEELKTEFKSFFLFCCAKLEISTYKIPGNQRKTPKTKISLDLPKHFKTILTDVLSPQPYNNITTSHHECYFIFEQ
jgi:hypothetical protein